MNRHYGIDLLKIFAMLMVVMLHVMRHGGITEVLAKDSHSIAYGAEQLLNTFCLCAVNCFVLASGYIMGPRHFKWGRLAKLWGQVAYYSVLMTALSACFINEGQITSWDWIKAILPISSNQYWFMTMYVALFCTMPLLNHILRSLDKKDLASILLGGFVLLSLYPTLLGKDLFGTSGGYSYLWFMYLYLVGGFVAVHIDARCLNLWLLSGGGVICAIISLALQVLSSQCHKTFGVGIGYWLTYSSSGIFLQAFLLLLLMSRYEHLSPAVERIIRWIAPSVFAVYLIHDNMMAKRLVGFAGMFERVAAYETSMMLLAIICSAIAIFVLCVLLDAPRRCLSKFIAVRFNTK